MPTDNPSGAPPRSKKLASVIAARGKRAAAASSGAESAEPTPSRSPLARRQETVAVLGDPKRRRIVTQAIAPGLIRISPRHDRNYTSLTAHSCRDLIEGFKRRGQEIPALVRPLQEQRDDEGYQYELVYGSRRHWTANFLGRDLEAEVRDVDDRTAFFLRDSENRDRRDISDHERAVSYRDALSSYFDGSQRDMAEYLSIDEGNFTRLLQLAELPSAIVKAYADLTHLKVHHGVTYRRLLKDEAAAARLLRRARALADRPADGKRVFSELKQAAAAPKAEATAAKRQMIGELEVVRRPGNRVAVNFTLPTDPQGLATLQATLGTLLDSLSKGDPAP